MTGLPVAGMGEVLTLRKPRRLLALPLMSGAGGTHHYHGYVKHPDYGSDPRHYVVALRLIQDDLQRVFEYVEPADDNIQTYSHRIHQLLFRACVEVEAHFRNILIANKYPRQRNKLGLSDYRLIETTHCLSEYSVRYPGWRGEKGRWQPFKEWTVKGANGKFPKLKWWESYNGSKHDRNINFKNANVETLMMATSALIVLYHSQYMSEGFSSGPPLMSASSGGYDSDDDMSTSILRPFRISSPEPDQYRYVYDFDWGELMKTPNPIETFDYKAN